MEAHIVLNCEKIKAFDGKSYEKHYWSYFVPRVGEFIESDDRTFKVLHVSYSTKCTKQIDINLEEIS